MSKIIIIIMNIFNESRDYKRGQSKSNVRMCIEPKINVIGDGGRLLVLQKRR